MAVNTRESNIALDKFENQENATEKEQRNSGMELVYNVTHGQLGFTIDLRIDRASDLNLQIMERV